MKGKPLVVPIDPSKLKKLEKRAALDAVSLIKEKRNGYIKGRTYANGAKQRRYVKAGEITHSPTVSLISILTTLAIYAYESRNVAIVDVPGAYIGMDFELNPYDLCIANKIVNGKQCTIIWYVDDNKISHVDPAVVDGIIK